MKPDLRERRIVQRVKWKGRGKADKKKKIVCNIVATNREETEKKCGIRRSSNRKIVPGCIEERTEEAPAGVQGCVDLAGNGVIPSTLIVVGSKARVSG